MLQVENEVGILGDARDRSPLAHAAWEKPVPQELIDYLQKHKESLLPEVTAVWERNGSKLSGTWAEVFGTDADAEEVFMAWHYGRYIGKVIADGKKEYPLPMYVNAWLVQNESQKAGGYPSGGPVSRMIDIWRAAAPQADLMAPDIYLNDFKGVCASYARSGNPLFIPEARGGAQGAANAFWAVAQHDALGFAPFGIDGMAGGPAEGGGPNPLGASYAVLAELAPVIAKFNGTGKMAGILQQGEQKESIVLGDYRINIEFPARRNSPQGGAQPGRPQPEGLAQGQLPAGPWRTLPAAARHPISGNLRISAKTRAPGQAKAGKQSHLPRAPAGIAAGYGLPWRRPRWSLRLPLRSR
jgi:hypothetical protein